MEQKLKDLTVFIGRFSPFHNGHAAVLERALKTSKAVLVLIGSSGQARNTKNPFTFDERKEMIYAYADSFAEKKGLRHCGAIENTYARLLIKPLYDQPYNDQAWIRGVQEAVDQAKNELVDHIGLNPLVYLTGADRDQSTWYLHTFGSLFTQDFVNERDHDLDLNATMVREILFSIEFPQDNLKDLVPHSTFHLIESFIVSEFYEPLRQEYVYIEKYKKAWATAPYAPTFLTTDCVVIQSGHVLVNVRDNFPGKGLWALPGGFLEQDEKLVDGAIRELKEETKIELSDAQLYGSIISKEIFDHPNRSLRGRTVTTAFLLKLNDSKPLPKTKPQKGEVKKTMWLTINDALRHSENWFEDHLEIVKWGISRATL